VYDDVSLKLLPNFSEPERPPMLSDKCAPKIVAVIGDVMIDRYLSETTRTPKTSSES
jgi:hypothetical protein